MSGEPGLTGSKRNRLSRTFRLTQKSQTAEKAESPTSQLSEFKTPTRIPRTRAGGCFSGESPHNDSDFQQDIIWDATSPNRLGKRGTKQRVGVVDISEIVSRIAPKHGRPEAAEPTLQQWIGDGVPCTPDVQAAKPKKKSLRPNGVDDLLKLARQFDLNMFRQDEGEEEEEVERSPELLPQDAGPDVPPDLNLEDDLDFLFDGPTQHLSADLSQASSQARPPTSSRCSASDAARANGTYAMDAFEDDWDVDNLPNDSLVLEMTQNPQNFATPMHCSTQRPSSPARLPVSVGQSAAEKPRQRTSFNLEYSPHFCVRTDARTNESGAPQSRFSSRPTSVTTNASAASHMAAPEVAQNHEAPAAADLLDDELLAVFSSDPGWDDPADDDLLCELCENLENQVRNPEGVSTKQTVGNQRAANQKALPATGSSFAGGFVSSVAAGAQTGGRAESAPQGNAYKKQFTFKKPSNPVFMTTNKAVSVCSAAEIELKKQQAIERRRRRLLATQTLRAPT